VTPVFRWKALAGIEAYEVIVHRGESIVQRSGKLVGTQWTPPTPLHRGVIYNWRVIITRDGQEFEPKEWPAEFKTLSEAQLHEVLAAERQAASSHLVRALIDLDAGLLLDAEHELAELSGRNPDSRLARQLLRSIQDQN
jgi:hypothetical protein